MPQSRISGKPVHSWLDDVLGLFPRSGLDFEMLRVVPASEVPEPYRALLVHEHHMTVTLERRHRRPVELEVLETRRSGDDYARRLVLRAGAAGPVVLAGFMRFWLRFAGPSVREEVLAARTPLGRILIESGVLRRIRTAAFLEVELRPPFAGVFERRPAASATFGRVATIDCDGEPAVELLEIVAPEPAEGAHE